MDDVRQLLDAKRRTVDAAGRASIDLGDDRVVDRRRLDGTVGWSLVMLAARGGHVEVMRELVDGDARADVLAVGERDGTTALHSAVERDRKSVV